MARIVVVMSIMVTVPIMSMVVVVVIFFSRLKNTKIGKEMYLSLNNLILEDIEGAAHTTLFDSTLIKPKQGYEFADPYARKVFDYLEDVKT